MTDSTTVARPRRTLTGTAVPDDLDTTITLAEWHRCRDTLDATWVVVPHEHQIDLAA